MDLNGNMVNPSPFAKPAGEIGARGVSGSMNMTRLMIRGLAHYWRWQVGLALGILVAAGVISGSLVTGDSVRATLARQAEVRLGKVASAVAAADGFFTEGLAARVLGAAPVLLVQGTVSVPGEGKRANGVNVYGVRDDFWTLGAGGGAAVMGEGIVINTALARFLKIPEQASSAKPEVIVRFEKPSLISRDAPLSGETDLTVTLRGAVAEVRADEAMGALSLKAQQEPALNVFVPLARLQAAVELPGRANLLLTASENEVAPAVGSGMTLEDAGLTWQAAGDQRILSTGRIFLSPEVADAARAALPEARGVLT